MAKHAPRFLKSSTTPASASRNAPSMTVKAKLDKGEKLS